MPVCPLRISAPSLRIAKFSSLPSAPSTFDFRTARLDFSLLRTALFEEISCFKVDTLAAYFCFSINAVLAESSFPLPAWSVAILFHFLSSRSFRLPNIPVKIDTCNPLCRARVAADANVRGRLAVRDGKAGYFTANGSGNKAPAMFRPGEKPELDAGRAPRQGWTYLSGLTLRPFLSTSKCTWGPVERPVEPINAIVCPLATVSPTSTRVSSAWP